MSDSEFDLDMDELSSAEDFLDYFGIDYDPSDFSAVSSGVAVDRSAHRPPDAGCKFQAGQRLRGCEIDQ